VRVDSFSHPKGQFALDDTEYQRLLLPVVGATAVTLLPVLDQRREMETSIEVLAECVGIGVEPTERAISRLQRVGVTRQNGDLVAVAETAPPIPKRLIYRAPIHMADAYESKFGVRSQNPALTERPLPMETVELIPPPVSSTPGVSVFDPYTNWHAVSLGPTVTQLRRIVAHHWAAFDQSELRTRELSAELGISTQQFGGWHGPLTRSLLRVNRAAGLTSRQTLTDRGVQVRIEVPPLQPRVVDRLSPQCQQIHDAAKTAMIDRWLEQTRPKPRPKPLQRPPRSL